MLRITKKYVDRQIYRFKLLFILWVSFKHVYHNDFKILITTAFITDFFIAKIKDSANRNSCTNLRQNQTQLHRNFSLINSNNIFRIYF